MSLSYGLARMEIVDRQRTGEVSKNAGTPPLSEGFSVKPRGNSHRTGIHEKFTRSGASLADKTGIGVANVPSRTKTFLSVAIGKPSHSEYTDVK